MSNIRWLVNYRTIDGVYPQPEIVFPSPRADPVFFLPDSQIRSAHEESAMKYMGDDIREIRGELSRFLRTITPKAAQKKLRCAAIRTATLRYGMKSKRASRTRT